MLSTVTHERHDSADAELGEFLDSHLKTLPVIQNAKRNRDRRHGFGMLGCVFNRKRCPLPTAQQPTGGNQSAAIQHAHVLPLTKPQGSNVTPQVIVERDGRSPLLKLRAIEVIHVVFLASTFTNTERMNTEFTCIRTYVPQPGVGAIQLNRPAVLNALSLQTMIELVEAFETYDADEAIRCIVIHGSEKAFAAGADITEMSDATLTTMLARDQFARWERIRQVKTPIIAAVSGFALGGGCELAMHADMIVASDTAQFGQPEINIGVMPGAGGTQRLTRAVGKALAMEIVLTGRMISAAQAQSAGLVNRVVPVAFYLQEAFALAGDVASKAPIAARLAKEAVLKAHSTTLEGGLEFERKNFYMLFATEDQKEGMAAFVEKRKPEWKGK